MGINALTLEPKPKHRLRTSLYATALLIGGGIIGAVVAGPTFGQGGPDGWRRGWSDGPQSQDEGPRWRRGQGEGPQSQDDGPRWRRGQGDGRQSQDEGPHWRRGQGDGRQSQDEGPHWRRGQGNGPQSDDGPGWHRRFGHGGMSHEGPGQQFGGGDFGGRMLYPGAIERGVNRVLGAVDASSEQRQKVRAIFERAADDLHGLRQQRADNRRQIAQALTEATIDRTKIETLRAERVKLSDATSKRLTDALVDAAEVLTPAQRADLGRRFERRRGG
jgi:Spy/CpxP family protein refolding chaperone